MKTSVFLVGLYCSPKNLISTSSSLLKKAWAYEEATSGLLLIKGKRIRCLPKIWKAFESEWTSQFYFCFFLSQEGIAHNDCHFWFSLCDSPKRWKCSARRITEFIKRRTQHWRLTTSIRTFHLATKLKLFGAKLARAWFSKLFAAKLVRAWFSKLFGAKLPRT